MKQRKNRVRRIRTRKDVIRKKNRETGRSARTKKGGRKYKPPGTRY